ncbi:MAG: hypothetical protein ACJKTH_03515 [Patescibacteria group bacterium UBA2163]
MYNLEQENVASKDFTPFSFLWGSVGSLAGAGVIGAVEPFESFEYMDEMLSGALTLAAAALLVGGLRALQKTSNE